jgi:putative two-component system response regulator
MTTSRSFRNARILIVDDEPGNVEILQRILTRAGFTRLVTSTDSRETVDLYVRHRPDLILLDLHMPHLDGLEVMRQLNEIAEATYLPILILSADETPEAKREALSRGAKDFVSKPFQQDEILLRIRTLLETRFLYIQVQSQNQLLEAKVRERTRALEDAQIEIVERLAMAAEFRDDNTGQHTQRVGQMSALIARQLGMPDTQVALMRRAAPLHDVGKIGIPDSILLKMGKLTPEEFEVVKTHTTIGAFCRCCPSMTRRKASTTPGSNCPPRCRSISATASATGHAGLYGRCCVSASNTSATVTMRPASGMFVPAMLA